MTKIILSDPVSLTNESTFLAAIAANNAQIETKSDTFLSRDGVSPNTMLADLDMNSHRMLNLLDASTDQEPITLSQFQGFQSAVLGDIQESLDFVFGSTPNLFMVRGPVTWGSRAILGTDLPTPTITTLGGVFSLSPGAGQVIGGLDDNGNLLAATSVNITAASSAVIAVGRQGVLNPAFQVDSSAVNSVTGLKISSQAAGNGVNVDVISSGADDALIVNAKGAGTINFGTNSTGVVSSFRNFLVNHNSTPSVTIGSTGNTQGFVITPGTGGLRVTSTGGGTSLEVLPVAATDENWIRLRSSSAGSTVILAPFSTLNTNVPIGLYSRGSATLLLGVKSSTNSFQILPNAGAEDRVFAITAGASGGAATNIAITSVGVAGGAIDIQAPLFTSVSDANALKIVKVIGSSTPAFRVDTSVASAITGLTITSRATGGGVDLVSSGDATTNLRVDTAGAGTITLNSVGTGLVQIGAAGAASTLVMGHTAPVIRFGTAGNVPAILRGFGSGGLKVQNDSAEQLFEVLPNAATGIVSRVTVTAVSAGGPTVATAGTAADINFSFSSKGAGSILFATGSGNHVNFQDRGAATTQTIMMSGAVAGSSARITTSGGDLEITPKIVSAGAFLGLSTTAIPAGGTAGNGLMFSTTTNFGVFHGSGAPTLSAAKGSLYLRSNGTTTNDRAYINTDGGTTWTALTTAA